MLPTFFLTRKSTRAAAEAPARVRLRILATSDLHCWLASYDYYRDAPTSSYGLARLATLVAQARAEVTNTILLDNGDLLQGNPLADYIAVERGLKPGDVHPAFKAMNLLGYDAATLGNHDFDYGLPFLERALSAASFPYVCANVVRSDGTPYFRPYAVLDKTCRDDAGRERTVRIGVFGVVPPQVAIWNRHQLEGKVRVVDMVEAARQAAKTLRGEGAELVVALCHSGFGHPPHVDGEENAAYAIGEIEGVDVIVAGHAHRVFPDISFADLPGLDLARGTLNGKPAVMPGYYGSHLGIVDLTLDVPKGLTDAQAHIRALHGAAVAPDTAVSQAIAADHHAAVEYTRRPVGTLAQGLDSFFAMVSPSPLLALIAEVQRWAVKRAMADEPELFAGHESAPLLIAAAPFRCGGRFGPSNYSHVAAGQVAIRNVADIYMYPNTIEVVAIDGATLREWLEMSAIMFNQIKAGHPGEQALLDRGRPSFDFDVIHGVEYTVDVTRPARYRRGGTIDDQGASRLTSLTISGKPVKDGDRFLVATTNYRSSGGGDFPGMDGSKTIYQSPEQMQELIVTWLRESGTVQPSPLATWRFAPFPIGSTVVFESAPEAANVIPAGSEITYLETMPDGFARFRLASV